MTLEISLAIDNFGKLGYKGSIRFRLSRASLLREKINNRILVTLCLFYEALGRKRLFLRSKRRKRRSLVSSTEVFSTAVHVSWGKSSTANRQPRSPSFSTDPAFSVTSRNQKM